MFLVGTFSSAAVGAESEASAEFVGSPACSGCHADEFQQWQRSHHGRSQALISGERAGDAKLADVNVSFHGQRTRFVQTGRENAQHWLARISEAGETVELPVVYRFGFEPLQQFVVQDDAGRLQVLNVAWDARPREQGGQRWFHLQADAAPAPGDFGHWRSAQMNWNRNCVNCHSTGYERRYDPLAERYASRFAEIAVGCEACHGPGSNHVASARQAGPVAELPVSWPTPARWLRKPGRPVATPSHEPVQTGVDQCSRCHSLRAELGDHVPGQSFLDGYAPVPMTPQIFHADGQVRGEAFVWGAFAQSKMFAAGVDCGDCHNPHSGELVDAGNGLCGQCHDADRYDSPSHHHHNARAKAAPECVDCHMRAVTVMTIDERRDHSFRIPRPDLAMSGGGPSACSDCHQQSEAWLAAAVDDWRADGAARTTGQTAKDVASRALASLWLEKPDASAALQRSLTDRRVNPYVQFTSASALGLSSTQLEQASIGDSLTRRLLQAAEQAQQAGPHNRDRSDGQVTRALQRLGNQDVRGALAALDRALTLDPNDTRAALLKAEVIEARDGADAATALLAEFARSADHDRSAIDYATAFTWVRAGQHGRAQEPLERAVDRAPEIPAYALGLALLHSRAGAANADLERAAAILKQARARHPEHAELLRAEIDVLIRLARYDGQTRRNARDRIGIYLKLGGDEGWARQMQRRLNAAVGEGG